MKLAITFLALFFSLSNELFAQSGLPDPTFGVDGYITHQIDSGVQYAQTQILSDGKILLYGYSYFDLTLQDIFVARFNEDGSTDATYGTGGTTILDISGRSDILIGGVLLPGDEFMGIGHSLQGLEYDLLLAKFKSNGQLDSTFGLNGILLHDFEDNDRAGGVALQDDSLLLVVGNVEHTEYDMAIHRFRLDGSIDSSFGTDGKVILDQGTIESLTKVEVQDDGKIFVSGEQGSFGTGPLDIFLARLHADGTLDSTWSDDGWSFLHFEGHDLPMSFHLLADQKVLVSGATPYFGPFDQGTGIARFTSDGSLDSTFGIDGKLKFTIGEWDWSNHMYVLDDDRFIITGSTITSPTVGSICQFYMACFLPDGSFDTNFGTDGIVVHKYDSANGYVGPHSSQLLADGRMLFSGIQQRTLTSDQSITMARYLGHDQIDLFSPEESTPTSFTEVHISPNPASSNFRASFELTQAATLRMQIQSLAGNYSQEVFSHLALPAGQHTFEITLPPDLPTGLYIISLHDKVSVASSILKYLNR